MDSILSALEVVADPELWLFIMLGSVIGLVLGLLPGLGGTVGFAILLPFVVGMDPINGVGLLVGMYAVTNTSDTFAAVLLGIPGTAGTAATVLDGYPLAKQGKAKTALAAAFTSSMFGGIIGGLALLVLIFAVRPIVLAMGSPELFMLTAVGITMIAAVSRSAPIAGLVLAVFGALVGTVGSAPATFSYRFSFGFDYLHDGIGIAVVALGLFAIPEFIEALARGRIAHDAVKLSGSRREGVLAVWRNKWLVFRSSLVGIFMGIMPGIGGSVGQWITYGLARQTVKDPSRMGKGDVRGVIAPEAGNNADVGGGLLPTIAFGIPGSGALAIFLAGFTLMGFEAGPAMLQGEGLSLSFAMVWGIILANVIGTAICFFVSGPISRLTLVPFMNLAPFLVGIIVVAAVQTTQHWADLIVLVVMGILGIALKRMGWPRAPFLIGFVLATPMETYFLRSINRYGMDWLTRPGVLIFATIIVTLIIWMAVKRPKSIPATAVERFGDKDE